MSLNEDDADMTVEDLQAELECCRHKVQDKEKALEERDTVIGSLHDTILTWQIDYESKCSQLREEQSISSTLRRQISDLNKTIAKTQQVETECKVLRERLALLER
jgi:septal ring factor EnvC (AmiA/AmiB activator)